MQRTLKGLARQASSPLSAVRAKPEELARQRVMQEEGPRANYSLVVRSIMEKRSSVELRQRM